MMCPVSAELVVHEAEKRLYPYAADSTFSGPAPALVPSYPSVVVVASLDSSLLLFQSVAH